MIQLSSTSAKHGLRVLLVAIRWLTHSTGKVWMTLSSKIQIFLVESMWTQMNCKMKALTPSLYRMLWQSYTRIDQVKSFRQIVQKIKSKSMSRFSIHVEMQLWTYLNYHCSQLTMDRHLLLTFKTPVTRLAVCTEKITFVDSDLMML